MKLQRGFTLIEILVVATIIGLLASISAVSYSAITKNSRDVRRKTDLENIRAAVEMYRVNNNAYPTGITAGSGITDGTNTYLGKVPDDPKPTTYQYYYSATSSTYSIGAFMEGTSACTSLTVSCAKSGSGLNCNYCVGPYGQLP